MSHAVFTSQSYGFKESFLLENNCHTLPSKSCDNTEESISKIRISWKELEVVSKSSSVRQLL